MSCKSPVFSPRNSPKRSLEDCMSPQKSQSPIKEEKLSGKNTAATISDPPKLGFCQDDVEEDKDILINLEKHPPEELKEGDHKYLGDKLKKRLDL